MKVLIIEDQRRIADSIQRGLENRKIVADVAYDGQDGYDLAVSEEYDAIVLDRMLPSMDGMEICAKLRERKIMTPILMLTAKGLVEDRVDGLEAGADDYLPKPFAFKELVARISALTRRKDKLIADRIVVADLELNLLAKQVKRQGKIIRLSKKEYSLLEFLLSNRQSVFTAQELAERVWSFDSNILENTVQVYIGYLRKKIDKPFSHSPALIKTIKGFGYTIETL